jgi:hypothetical protein
MSNQILAELLSAHAFDSRPLHIDMPVFHVPFDDRGRRGTESGVVRAAQSTERLGVRGPIGSGKTSLLRYTLDDPRGMIAPIWVSVAFDDDQVVLDVRRFAAHLIQSIVRDAQRAAKFWVANAEPAGEVTSTLAGVDLQRPAGEVLENVNRRSKRLPRTTCWSGRRRPRRVPRNGVVRASPVGHRLAPVRPTRRYAASMSTSASASSGSSISTTTMVFVSLKNSRMHVKPYST